MKMRIANIFSDRLNILRFKQIITSWSYRFSNQNNCQKMYEGNPISKLQIQVATYVFQLSAGICHR